MADPDASPLPNVAEILGQVLARVEPGRRALVVAIAERMAAERYRGWSADPGGAAHRSELLACARREEEIAARVEALYPDAETLVRDFLAKNPDLEEINRSLFAGRPLGQQFLIQAGAERIGAGTWRAFAAAADPGAAAVFEACALLEQQNAAALDGILASGA